MRPTAISLFSGAGGLCLGFEQAGFDITAAVEVDPVHATTHRVNFPVGTTLAQPVEALSAKDFYLYAKEPDVLIGGPPCQGYSISGRRSHTDPRNSLIHHFVRLVSELQPKYFVLENVKGLTLTHCLPVLEDAIAQLMALGYRLPKWRILNAKNYRVPQNRERLFLLGSRRDMPPVVYPKGTGRVTVGEALMDLPNINGKAALTGKMLARPFIGERLSDYAREMRCSGSGCWHYGYRRVRDQYIYNCHGTNHSAEVIGRFSDTAPGDREPISHFHRLEIDGISPTLRAGTDAKRGRHTAPRPIHYGYSRCITVREMARLSGFPDWFRFDDRKWHGARQVGNAVPPPLGRAIASEIYKSLYPD